jgi:gliding motility-associated-like protein
MLLKLKIKLNIIGIWLVLLLIVPPRLFAQLAIDTTLTPQQLVQNVLMGNGVTASNIVFKGAHHDTIYSIAKFSGATNIGLPAGVVMTTGTTTGKNGPQGPNSSTQSGIDNAEPGDSLLSSVNSNTTLNATTLEFDFVPTGDSINFHYVFGSEEYPEYACGNFNDIFGFFISGPKPGGGNYVKQNIAIIPGTALPVSIKNINKSGCSTYSKYYIDNAAGTTIQYDGFTTPLTAIAPVTCGSTYHIKLAIADVSDGLFDSGVFLEAGSFSSTSISVNSNASFGVNDTTIFEGCGHTFVTLKRSISSAINSDSIDYTLTGTASNSVDYTLSSSNITGNKVIFPIGVDSVRLDFNAIQDFIPEGLEYFTLTLNIKLCNKYTQKTVTVYIADVTPLTITASNDTTLFCPNSPVTLKAFAKGGLNTLAGYKYIWSNGATGSSISVNPNSTTQYVVNVKDTCGLYNASDTINVFVNYVPISLNVSSNVEICSGGSAALIAKANYGRPGYTYNWKPTNDTITGIIVAPGTTTTYTVTVKDQCGQSAVKTVTVRIAETKADFNYTFAHNLQVDFSNTSVEADSSLWFFGDSAFSTVYNPSHVYADSGIYKVKLIVYNAIGCTDTIEHTFLLFPDLEFYFPNSFSPNNDGRNDVFTGKGYGIYRYLMKIYDRWGNLIFTSEDANIGWDGKNKSGKTQMDSYVCVFDVEDFFGHSIHRTGNVMLVR